jgi:hypothetical protein
MVMLAEQYEYVIGGDPDRDTIDVAVLATATVSCEGIAATMPTAAVMSACWPGRERRRRAVASGR